MEFSKIEIPERIKYHHNNCDDSKHYDDNERVYEHVVNALVACSSSLETYHKHTCKHKIK